MSTTTVIEAGIRIVSPAFAGTYPQSHDVASPQFPPLSINVHIAELMFVIIKNDINTEIIHSFDKLSLDLLAIIYESFCNYLDNTDEGISGILEDLSNKIAGRGF